MHEKYDVTTMSRTFDNTVENQFGTKIIILQTIDRI